MSETFTKEDMRTIALEQRARFREVLLGLSADQWSAPSLCTHWRVRDVAAHVAHNASAGMFAFLVGMARTKFDHDQYNLRSTAQWAVLPKTQLLRALEGDHLMLIFRLNPFLPVVDTIVHLQDIRRPLGLGTDVPERHLLAALTAVTTEKMFEQDATRANGLRLVATDLPWTHGSGPVEVRGTGEALLMALMGRQVDQAEFGGIETLPSTATFGRSSS